MAHLHRLVQESLNALGQPGFRRTFIRFLALQRYDLTPHRRLFDTIDVDDRIQDGKVTIGGNPISGEDLATRFVDFLSGAARQWELAQLAEEFWRTFPEAVGGARPREYVRACEALGDDYELRCLVPMLRTPLHVLSPRRVLDFGCGANRLGPAMQVSLQRAGLPVPTVIGVDVYLPENAYADPARGVHLHDLGSQSLAAILARPVDLVILSYVLHHMTESEQEEAMAMLDAALVPGGRIILLEASVDTNDGDLALFEATQRSHESWPGDDWVAPYRAVSRDFYQASTNEQRMLLCLEDVFGHVLLPGPTAAPLRMPLPFSYVGRDEVARLAGRIGLQPDHELSAVLGMPPTLKHGPPSSRFVFQHGS